jgi:hypothetical protein
VDSDDVWAVLCGLMLSWIGWRMLGQRGYVDIRFGYIDFGPHHDQIGMFVLCVGAIIVLAILAKRLRM